MSKSLEKLKDELATVTIRINLLSQEARMIDARGEKLASNRERLIMEIEQIKDNSGKN